MTNLIYSKIVLNLEDDKKAQAFNFVNVFAFGISGKLITKNHPENSIGKIYWKKYET